MAFRTTQDFTYEAPARRISLFIPAGTEVQFVGTNGGIATTNNFGVSRPQDLPECDRFDAEHYWYWIPDNIVEEVK